MLDIKFIRENPEIVKNACRVKGDNPALTAARLYLCTAFKQVLENGLSLFKVTAPESM